MLLASFNHYEKEPKQRFANGTMVFLDYSTRKEKKELEGPYEIEKATFNKMSGVFMYQFKDKGFACGEMYLKKQPTDKKLSIDETVHISIGQSNMLEMLKSPNPISDALRNQGGRQASHSDGTHGIVFFQPDDNFVSWIKKYANGRIILDVGCGTGDLTILLNRAGARVVGIDPMMNYDGIVKEQMIDLAAGISRPHFLNKKIEDLTSLFVGRGEQVLIIFARPSHGNYVHNTLKLKDKNTEALYITKPTVMEDFDDLREFRKKATLIPHEGRSTEQEQVWSIK